MITLEPGPVKEKKKRKIEGGEHNQDDHDRLQ